MKRLVKIPALLILTFAINFSIFAAPSIDRLLSSQISASPLALTPVVITFDHKVGSTDFLMLKSLDNTPPNQINIVLNWYEDLKRRAGSGAGKIR